ncbi:secretion-regulating guanine nucleotide exchange factor-like [Diadema antillarum]|uniref:secretion-regulating guanine nucleotide exchange factor-like n=1 Tax=Diadema antillarum TaxID=105358 RepID=UPI003A86A05B
MEVMTSGSRVNDPGQGDGQLLCWGGGEFGQHGHSGNDENVGSEGALVDQVEKLVGLHRIKHVACGASHTAVVTDKDEILTWGNGNSGQLGCGEKVTHTTPQRLKLAQHDSVVAGVVCGSRHTVVWLENGRAYSCGNNFYAQLGYDFRIKNYKENQVMKERLIDQVAGRERPLEVLPHLLRPIMHRKVTQVACGEKFTLFLFDTGHVAGCGANSFGQLGTSARSEVVSPKPLEDPEEVVKVACGSCHSLAVTASGELYVWGMGRPCGSRRDDVLTPQLMMTRHSNVVSVAGGSSHSLALTANGTVYSFGGGGEGQLGHGEEVTYLTQPKPLPKNCLPGRVSQVACGDGYSAALLADGSLFMWGKSSHVIESSQPSSRKVFQPVQIPFQGRSVAMVACGAWHAAALTGKPGLSQ